jgi:vitamin B12 transporter
MQAIPIDPSQIVITASRAPETEARSPASVTVIDSSEIVHLGEPVLTGFLRLTPSAAITVNGPAGSLSEVRIRGAEANHSLLFVDGIKINDPASGDTPRFELLNADLASRIEVVRGPQSALWGSDAIGGVIAVNGLDQASGSSAAIEAGSFGFRRASASTALRGDKATIAAAVGWQRATGIDSFGSPGGDRDGYRNLSGRIRAVAELSPTVKVGAAGLALTGASEFDGYDLVSFEHEDTLDSSDNRLFAGRLWSEFGGLDAHWSARLSASLLGSSNRNDLAGIEINRTRGTRRTIGGEVDYRLDVAGVPQRLIVAAEDERETFRARDSIYAGATDQDRARAHRSLTAEWRAEGERFTADLAVRRDFFDAFRDSTSLRASALARLGGGFALSGGYAKGIAQPTFFDLYGFFPGNFVGNPELSPESSNGFEAALRYRRGSINASLTAYRQRLHDEIVNIYDPVTFLQTSANRQSSSRRSGIEAEASWQASEELRLSATYAYLDASEPDSSGDRQIVELRRPRHSGSIAADGAMGKWTYGASLAYVGPHFDSRDSYPYDRVRLHSYWLAGARVAYSIATGVELFARASNLFDQDYQDSAGYRTEGRGLFAGVRLAGRRSSP